MATLSVRVQLQRINGNFVVLEPKTRRSRRAINLPAACVSALRRPKIPQAQERLLAGPDWQHWGWHSQRDPARLWTLPT